jgi:hypothetical protein
MTSPFGLQGELQPPLVRSFESPGRQSGVFVLAVTAVRNFQLKFDYRHALAKDLQFVVSAGKRLDENRSANSRHCHYNRKHSDDYGTKN